MSKCRAFLLRGSSRREAFSGASRRWLESVEAPRRAGRRFFLQGSGSVGSGVELRRRKHGTFRRLPHRKLGSLRWWKHRRARRPSRLGRTAFGGHAARTSPAVRPAQRPAPPRRRRVLRDILQVVKPRVHGRRLIAAHAV